MEFPEETARIRGALGCTGGLEHGKLFLQLIPRLHKQERGKIAPSLQFKQVGMNEGEI